MNDNLKEFKQCILNYEAITISDIQNTESYSVDMNPPNEVWSSEAVMEELTGFGKIDTCSLCEKLGINESAKFDPSEVDCKYCTWMEKTSHQCGSGSNYDTYHNFTELEIDSEEALVEACKTRAEYMRDVIDWHDEKQLTIKFEEK